jgi:uncharacterized protein
VAEGIKKKIRIPLAITSLNDRLLAKSTLANGAGLILREIMNRGEIIARLRENEAALRKKGVAHAALFGSRARGDQRPDSDTDIMIEFDPTAQITVFDYAGLKDYIAELFEGHVDVVNRDGLKPYVKPAASTDAIYAF